MVNIEKYKNDGWGLSKKCLLDIERILNTFDIPINIIEFGSGQSTIFLVDYLNEHNKKGYIFSFDNELEYTPKIVDDKLRLNIRNLVETDDNSFNEMFKIKVYDQKKMKIRVVAPHTRQKNCFYSINENDLPDNCDLCIVDGSHGNGRSIAFLHLIGKLKPGSYVVIDDFTHYDFTERFKTIFPNSELYVESKTGRHDQWNLGGHYRIFKTI